MKIRFLGGVGTVTGSKSLLTTERHQFMIDCGLFQGVKRLRLRNWERFPIDPHDIDAILLTHAHLDHCGYLPLLVRQGFRGRIYSSSPTRALAELILLDSARLQDEDADYANRKGFSRHQPAQALYGEKDVHETMRLFKSVSVDEWHDLPGGSQFRLSPSGHILGSTFVEFLDGAKKVVFSGDLGREHPTLYPRPSLIAETDALVIESTYGDRTHHIESPQVELSKIIASTVSRGGQLIVPSFAVGRVQELLRILSKLKAESQLPAIPIYLDSPMGTRATEIFETYPDWHTLSSAEVTALWDVCTVIQSQEQSIRVMREDAPAVIIAGSGMVSGGRVLHHLFARLPDPKNAVLLVGYQAEGTRGRLLQNGISELKIHGKYVPVRASVHEITGLSAHADQTEIVQWLRGFKRGPSQVFINHGEPQASDALRVKIQDEFSWECTIPQESEEFTV